MKKLLITTSIAAICTLSMSSTLYADNDAGFYLGAGVHRANFDRGSVASSDTKGDLSMGYMFNDRWGIDGTLYNFVDDKKDNVSVLVAGLSLTGVYKIPVSQRVDLYGKAGLIRTGIEIKQNNNKILDENGNDFILGLGAKVDFGKHNVLLEYVKVDPGSANLDVVSLGYRYEF